MNTTRTLTVPLALAAAGAAALAVTPSAELGRVLPDAAAFVERITAAVVGGAFTLAVSSPAVVWVLVGFATAVLIAARLAMGWQARPDEHEGFDVR